MTLRFVPRGIGDIVVRSFRARVVFWRYSLFNRRWISPRGRPDLFRLQSCLKCVGCFDIMHCVRGVSLFLGGDIECAGR